MGGAAIGRRHVPKVKTVNVNRIPRKVETLFLEKMSMKFIGLCSLLLLVAFLAVPLPSTPSPNSRSNPPLFQKSGITRPFTVQSRATNARPNAYPLPIDLTSKGHTIPPSAPLSVMGNAGWEDKFGGPPGVYGDVYAMADQDRVVYVGGNFHGVQGVAANNIAMWDGSRWSALGKGVDGIVTAVAVSGEDVYIGGTFVNAGNVKVNHVAKWNGKRWSALGAGISGFAPPEVNAIAIRGNKVYVGGLFSSAGRVGTKNIAEWDGTHWTGMGGGSPLWVYGLATTKDYVYAVGLNAPHIQKWDGRAWTDVGGGADDLVTSIAVQGTDVYIGGNFKHVGAVPADSVAKWDGTNWTAFGGTFENGVDAIAVHGNEVFVGGRFRSINGDTSFNRIARWDGSVWKSLDNGRPADISALVIKGDRLYVGLDQYLSETANHWFVWQNNQWSLPGAQNGQGVTGVVRAMARVGGLVFVGGSISNAGPLQVNNIAAWNGTNSLPLGSGLDGQVNSMAVIGSDLYVAGDFSMAGGVTANHIARWDGSKWSALDGSPDVPIFNLIAYGNHLYAGGEHGQAGNVWDDFIQMWDGTHWSQVGRGFDRTDVTALAADGSNLYVGLLYYGEHYGPSTTAAIAQWNGDTWTDIFGVPYGFVDSLIPQGSYLYASGNLSNGYGGVARWDGSTWTGMVSGINNRVGVIALQGNTIYATGIFDSSIASPLKGIAKWDGVQWRQLGSGIEGTVNAIDVQGNQVVVGGEFTQAGGKPSHNFAVWDEPACTGKPGKPVLQKPQDQVHVKTLRAHLRWSNVECADYYDVTVKKGNQYGPRSAFATVYEPTYQPDLLPHQRYAWQVSACNYSTGCSNSDWRIFILR